MSKRISHESLKAFSNSVLASLGAEPKQARIFSDALIWSDLIGRPNHGVWRLPAYVKRFMKGLIKCPCSCRVNVTGHSSATIDGDSGFGHYVGHVAMAKAISLADDSGIGITTAHHSNHFGVAAYFVEMAAQAGKIGIATSNSIAKLAPVGGVSAVFGTNPIAIGAPRESGQSIILDMATAAVSGASIIRAVENGEDLPEGAVVDAKGQPIIESSKASEGVMLPFGGAKGGGLAFVVELLSGVITEASLSTGVRSMFGDFSGNGDNGHCFIAIDVKRLLPINSYYARLEELVTQMKTASPGNGPVVRLPGELRWESMQEQLRNGILLDEKTAHGLVVLGEKIGVEVPECLSEKVAT